MAQSLSPGIVVTAGEALTDTAMPCPWGVPPHPVSPDREPVAGSFPSPDTASFPHGFIKAVSKRGTGRAGDGEWGHGVCQHCRSLRRCLSHARNTPAPRAAAAHSSLFTCSDTRESGHAEADAPSPLPGSSEGLAPLDQGV